MILTLDIETIPCQDPEICSELASNITAPAQYKKPESIAAWLEENREAEAEKVIAKTSFDGALGQVLCIGYKFDGYESQVTDTNAFGDERAALEYFRDHLMNYLNPHDFNQLTVVGHNVASFDLRFLFQRYIVNGIKPPPLPFHAKPWDTSQVFDTMTYFAGVGNRISLDKLARALGVGGKGEVTGADVWPMYKAGLYEEIAAYCKSDVDLTYEVYKRLTFMEVLA